MSHAVTRYRLQFTSSCAALGLVLVCGATHATAQSNDAPVQTAPNPAQAAAEPPAVELDEVVVVGTRASLQSGIERKRNADTNVDSIVAEDVSQFPDKNIGEALSRITGVQLTRNFGEGVQVSIRGVEPDLNRVEINGVGVLNNTETGERGANLQDLASELVASIDVYKGYMADMTEGGVGGTVRINTRKPLDLTKPLFSMSGSAQQLDMVDDTTFRGNLTLGDKFLDDRLGVIFNATYDDNQRASDYMRNTEWNQFDWSSSNSGDFDNSPEKTYIDAAYADAATKADCPTGTGAEARDCLNQWNDNLPRIPRYNQWRRSTERTSITGTVQYRFTDRLTGYVEYTGNRQKEELQDFNYVVNLPDIHRLNAVVYDRNGNPDFSLSPGQTSTQYAVVDDDHNVIDLWTAGEASTGSSGSFNTIGANGGRGAGSIFNTQSRSFDADYQSDYVSGGFEWKGDRLNVKGLVARAETFQSNNSNNVQFNAAIPNINIRLGPDGTPQIIIPEGYDLEDPATYGMFANNGAGVNYTTSAAKITYRPVETEGREDTVKLDFDYLLDTPFFKKFEVGYQYGNRTQLQYSSGGHTLGEIDPVTGRRINPIVVQGAAFDHVINIDPRLLADGGSVFNFLSQPANQTTNLTQASFLQFANAVAGRSPGDFFGGAGYDPGFGLMDSWLAPDVAAALAYGLTDLSYFDHDLLHTSVGRNADGEIVGEFAQIPALDSEETVNAGYVQTHFLTELFGRQLMGNAGLRYVRTETASTGSYRERQTVDNPAGGNPITEDVSEDIVSINNTYEDWLPTLNLKYEITDKVQALFSAAKVMARPKFGDLRPNATCILDRTGAGVGDDNLDTCSAGNPDLDPYRANQYDFTVGYYADRDTLFNASFFYKDVKSFIVGSTLNRNVDLFGNGNLYDVTQPINGQGAKIFGIELSAQTAFTFLPAPFDGFGGILNYTFSDAKDVGLFNELTGEELGFPGLSRDSYNVIVYYDKGPINARVAYNGRTRYLREAADRTGNPVFREGSAFLDARFSYRVGRNLTLFAEGKNLTDEVEISTAGSIRQTEVQWSGRRYFLGFTYKY